MRQRTGDLDRKRIIEILLPPVIVFLVNSAVYWGAPRLADNGEYHNLSLALDTKIPLIPAFILVYFGCYIFWVINYLLVSLREEEIKYRFFTADLYARIICFLFFVFYPTTNVRPELVGNGIFVQGMRFLYQIDEPVNLFPSIHCMASWFCCIGIRGDKKVPVWYKIVSVMIAVLVFVSTLVTKQHVIVDGKFTEIWFVKQEEKMENKKKMIFNVLFLFLVFAATIYGVFHGEDLSEIAEILKTVNSYWLLPGVVCVIIFIWGESIIIFYMMHTLGIHLKKWKCFLFSSVGFFFSCITPSATGGQPAQIYYMKKEKIPIPVSTLVLMIVTITYKMVLVVIGLGLMIFGRGFIRTHMYDIRHIFYLGTGLNVFCVSSMLLLVFHPVLARSILVKGMELLEKMHLMRHKSTRIEKLNASMDQYHTTAVYLKDHIMVLVNVFAITLFQRFALFTATWFVYKAFGLSGTNAFVIILLQSVISVSVDMLPLPGGMGISEKLFSMIFEPVFGSALLIPGMILSRGLGYYTELLISAIFTIVANFTIGRKHK